jgi:hypothetical protein
MTTLGKILVLLTTTLSLAMAAWALGVYTQRIDWASKPSSSKAAQDELSKRVDRIKGKSGGWGLWDSLAAAEARWKTETQTLGTLEPLRAQNKAVYDKQLAQTDRGTGTVKTVAYKDGRLVLDPNTGQPVLADATDGAGAKLRSRDYYVKTYNERQEEIVKAMDELAKWLKPEIWEKLPKKDGMLDLEEARKQLKQADFDDKGLFIQDAKVTATITEQRQLLFQEQDKRQRVLAEQEYLRPLLVNTAVESELVVKRREALQARVEELRKSAGIASSR